MGQGAGTQMGIRGVAFLVALSIGLLGAESAQAEQCSPDGKICLLTEATPENPYRPPQAIQVAVDSAAEQVTIGPSELVSSVERVVAGPPGGMSIWQAAIRPLEFDGPISLDVYAQVGTPPALSYSYTATFRDLPVLATVLFGDSQIRRMGDHYVATFSYTARQPVTISQQLAVTTREPYTGQATTATTEPRTGPGTASMSVAASTVRQLCRTHLRCYLWLTSNVYLGGALFGQEQLAGDRIKTPRLQCLKRVKVLLERSKRLRKRNPKLRRRYRRQAGKLHPRCYDWSVQKEEPSAGAHPPEERPPLLRDGPTHCHRGFDSTARARVGSTARFRP